MAGDYTGCAALKKSKSRHSDNSSKSDNNESNSKTSAPVQTRGGLRVYKIVILGDGGVGKSGMIILILKSKFN